MGVVFLKSCYKYDIETGQSKALPDLIRGRWASSSCVLAEYVYTFAGHQGQYINSIEKLKVKGAPGPESSAWQAIPPSSSFTPRAWPVVCPLNDFEIVIIGGDIQDGY